MIDEEEKRHLDCLKQVLGRAKNYRALEAIKELEKENIKLLDKLNLQNQRLNELKKENEELKESVEDWKADHTHNLELMKGLNDRIEELQENIENLEYENGCLKMEVMCIEKSKDVYKKISEQLQEKLREISNCVQNIDFTQSQFFIEKIKELVK